MYISKEECIEFLRQRERFGSHEFSEKNILAQEDESINNKIIIYQRESDLDSGWDYWVLNIERIDEKPIRSNFGIYVNLGKNNIEAKNLEVESLKITKAIPLTKKMIESLCKKGFSWEME